MATEGGNVAATPSPGKEGARRKREHQRHMEAAFNELGARFVQWALRNGHEPVKYAKLGRGWHKLGRSWYIGDLGTTAMDPDRRLGAASAVKRDHAVWFVLTDGTVTTSADIGVGRLGAESDTQRFIEVVRTNWGCDLDQEPPASQPRPRRRIRRSARSGAD
jgi:hypothetical protein